MIKHIALLITLLACSNPAGATDFYVSPQGDDKTNGLSSQPGPNASDGPFRSLLQAQLAIRELKKAGKFDQPVTVHIEAGNYALDKPLEFDLRDSGFVDRPIQWQGEKGDVTISAGMALNCTPTDNRLWECPLNKQPVNTTYFDTGRIKGTGPKFELFTNNRKQQLARWPDHDWAHIKLPIDARTQFSAMEKMPALEGNIKAAQVHIFAGNDWYDQYIGIDSIDPSANSLKLSDATGYNLESGRRFYIQNLPSLLNEPGEWIYDQIGNKILLIPEAGTTPTNAIVSSLPKAVLISGANYLSFSGFTLQHSAGNAITLKDCSNITLDKLEISNVGGKGVEILNGQNVHLTNSKIHHTGGHGIVASGGNRNTLQPSGHLIHNDHIHHIGTTILTYSSGIEMNGVGAKATHNLLEYGDGTAVLITGNDHLVEKNEIHHFCLQASDCGAIYSGRNWSWRGNVIRHNYIHDIETSGMISLDLNTNQVRYGSPDKPPGGSRGVYLDDGVAGFSIIGNIFENAGLLSIQIGGGRDTKVVNNYFKTNATAIYMEQRFSAGNLKTLEDSPYRSKIWQQHYPELAQPMHAQTLPEGNQIQRNVIVTAEPTGRTLLYYAPRESTQITDNIVWSTNGKFLIDYRIFDPIIKTENSTTWSQWLAEGIEQNSLMADPCVTIINKTMHTCPDSPIKQIGFEALPTDIGLLP